MRTLREIKRYGSYSVNSVENSSQAHWKLTMHAIETINDFEPIILYGFAEFYILIG